MPSLELHTVRSTAMTHQQREDIIALCSAVFGGDYACYMNLGYLSTHVLGYAGPRLVAHALWLERRLRTGTGPWLNAAYVEGVATDAAFRGRGCGSTVMRRLQGEIAGYDLGALSPAQEGWYLRLGWRRWQGPLLIDRDGALQATLGECVLVYPTPRTPTLDFTATLTAEWRQFELW